MSPPCHIFNVIVVTFNHILFLIITNCQYIYLNGIYFSFLFHKLPLRSKIPGNINIDCAFKNMLIKQHTFFYREPNEFYMTFCMKNH